MDLLYSKAIEYLKTDTVKNLATLKYLLLFKNNLEISLIEDAFDWALLIAIPIELLWYDSANYPEAKQTVFVNGTSDELKYELLDKLKENNYVIRTNKPLDFSPLKNRYQITYGNSYVSYTCNSGYAAIKASNLKDNVQRHHILTDEAIALITNNGYTEKSLREFFGNDSVWFGYISEGIIKSICFVYQNYEDIWEIAGVHTIESERNKGYGRAVVTSAIEYLLEKGLTPRYGVNIKNAASINLAESLGMKQFLRIDHFLLKTY